MQRSVLKDLERISAYRTSCLRTIAYNFLCIATLGLVYLLRQWSKRVWTWTMVQCDDVSSEYYLLKGEDGSCDIVKSERIILKGLQYTLFRWRMYRYIYTKGHFEVVQFTDFEMNCDLHVHDYHQTESELKDSLVLFGTNSTQVPTKPILKVLCEELISPLFIFQLFTFILWTYEGYVAYSAILFAVSLYSVVETLIEYDESRKQLREICDDSWEVDVFRFGNITKVCSKEIVPGDILIILPNIRIPCDAVLIEGDCVMDESMLTGEHHPIQKTSLPKDKVKFKFQRSSMIYATTQTLQGRGRAFVLGTGFETEKGRFIRKIMFQPQISHDFMQDSFQYLKYLSILAVIGYLVALPFKIKFQIKYPQIPSSDLITDALDLITVSVPPTLPTSLQLGLNLALRRYKRKGITCANAQKINSAGVVQRVCFEKSGVLTEEQLTVFGALEVYDNKFSLKYEVTNKLLLKAMAVCHSLIQHNNHLLGDQLDLTLFKASKAKILSPESIQLNEDIIAINQKFQFTKQRARISVIVNGNHLFMKGAPEKIKNMCNLLPEDYLALTTFYAHNGYKIIAYAHRLLSQEDTQEQCEQNLTFLGFVVLHQKLKFCTSIVIDSLKGGSIAPVLITGDNLLVSTHTARQSNILNKSQVLLGELINNKLHWRDFDQGVHEIELQLCENTKAQHKSLLLKHSTESPQSVMHLESVILIDEFNYDQVEPLYGDAQLALTSAAFDHLVKFAIESNKLDIIDILVKRVVVFAKMQTDHKRELVEYMQRQEPIAYCGVDTMGADVGISLTQTKFSTASPFTSSIQDITCVPFILAQGRAALKISFYAFQYMTISSLIQFISCTLLYFQYAYMTNSQYLVIDLLVTFPLTILISFAETVHEIANQKPQKKLLSVTILSTVLGLTFIQLFFQAIVYVILIQMNWYVEAAVLSASVYGIEGFVYSFETTSLFLISNFQYIFVSIALLIDNKYIKPFYQNTAYFAYALAVFIFSLYLLLFTKSEGNQSVFNLTYKVVLSNITYEMPNSWIIFLTFMVTINSMLTIMYAKYGVSYVAAKIKQ